MNASASRNSSAKSSASYETKTRGCFSKQIGRWAPNADGELVKLRSKKDAGRLLDGREWSEVPDPERAQLSTDGGPEVPEFSGLVGRNSPIVDGIRT